MKRRLSIALAGLLSGAACTVKSPVPSTSFEASDGCRVTVYTMQRIPEALGGEQYVFLELACGSKRSTRVEIDINGRFGDRLHVDTSADSEWARAYLDMKPPLVGEIVPINQGEGGYWFKSYAGGETEKQIVFPYSIVAYVHFPTGFVLKHSCATVQERGSILGLVAELPAVQVIRFKCIEWRPTRRR